MDSSIQIVEARRARDSGYANRHYAQSLEEFGAVQELPRCRGWLLVNRIPNSDLFDGMGCYPLFCCQDWCALQEDLASLAENLVSVRIVTDPFAQIGLSQLKGAFSDVCYDYKQHFVADLTLAPENFVSSHHQRNVRRAMQALVVHRSTDDPDLLSKWQDLYDNLVRRHGVDGIARFSPLAFERQMMVPGLMAFSALAGNDTCGMMLWYVRGEIAYYHLGAYSDQGYENGASFALFWHALKYFAGSGLRWASLGAGAGLESAESGLTRFKRGWATHTRPVYFCGRIFQPAAYAKLASGTARSTGFFPAYRAA